MTDRILKDFDVYSRALMSSKDVDPTYLIIPEIVNKFKFEPLWFTFVYVAFYNLETAIKMCRIMPNAMSFRPLEFERLRKEGILYKFGHERRGTQRQVHRQIDMFNEIKYFICKKKEFQSKGVFDDNITFKNFIASYISNHGSWATFKIAEILEKSFPEEYASLEVPDLGLDGRDPNSNDGPVGGLRWLFGRDLKYGKDFFEVWNFFGKTLAEEYKVNIGLIETCLCKFHKLVSGKYYIGHDIVEFHELEEVLGSNDYHEIMSKHFDEKFWLGKTSVEKSKKVLYNKNGIILSKGYSERMKSVDIKQIIMEL